MTAFWDKQHMAQLYEDYYSPLCRYAFTFVKDKSTAEDIVSETFYTIYSKRSKLSKVERVKSYLFKSVHNNCLYHLREQKEDAYNFDLYQEPIADIKNAMDEIIIKEIGTELDQAIEALPEQQRKVFCLKYISKKKNREVAQELNLSIKTIEMHMGLALKTLRKQLQLLSGHIRSGP